MVATFFMLCVFVSILIMVQTLHVYFRQNGLLAFMPKPVQHFMQEVSFFDILVNIFIYKRMSKMVVGIVKPFLSAKTPEDAKKLLKKEVVIPPNVYRALLRKGIMNSLPK